MKTYSLTLPVMGLLVGTRALAGAGLALLLAEKLRPDQRRSVGWTLLATGILTTFPLATLVFSHRSDPPLPPSPAPKHP